MTGPTPCLNTLHVESPDSPWSVFPDGFLGGSAPSLHTLRLQNVLPPFPSAPHLTSLAVGFDEFMNVNGPLIDQLSDCISDMPRLQYLELALRIVTEEAQTSSFAGIPTSLSELKILVFSGRSHQLEVLLQRIDAPGIIRLEVNLELEHPSATVPSLLRFICHSPKTHTPACTRIAICEGRHSSINAYLWHPYLSRVSIGLNHVRSVDLGTSMASVAAVCQSLAPALSTASRLSMESGPHHSTKDPWLRFLHHVEEWRSILATFSKATELVVESIHAMAVSRALQQPSGHELLPNLRDLEIGFYTGDALGPSDVSAELEPVIAARNAGATPYVEVCYKENIDDW
ncbi:hypothetical protein BC834DRAFT_908770 [Gloeopeniophorella convolvens]|nr:hypothetical protein BC834DRAFT_908770 [Gloeopeniophorella convolvens]